MRASLSMTTRQILLLTVISLAMTGCRTSSRWASLNPWSSGGQETSLAARTAPELPTAQSENPGGTAIASNATTTTAPTGGEAPPFVAASTAPLGGYPSTGVLGSPPPVTTAPPVVAATPKPPAMPSAGPYDPSGYTPPPEAVAAAPGANRYGSSRYTASNSSPLASIPGVPASTPVANSGNRYGSNLASAPPAATTPALPSMPSAPVLPNIAGLPPAMPVSQPIAQTSAEQAPVSTTPGGYRPGGTSSYDPQVSVALRTAPEAPAIPGAQPAATQPTVPAAPAYPVAPAYPSTPGYRY